MASPTCVEMVLILPCGLAVTRFSSLKAKEQQLMFIPVNCQQALRPSQEPREKRETLLLLQLDG